jgi:hypothetical protein
MSDQTTPALVYPDLPATVQGDPYCYLHDPPPDFPPVEAFAWHVRGLFPAELAARWIALARQLPPAAVDELHSLLPATDTCITDREVALADRTWEHVLRHVEGLRAPLELARRHCDGDGTELAACGTGWKDCRLWPGHDPAPPPPA